MTRLRVLLVVVAALAALAAPSAVLAAPAAKPKPKVLVSTFASDTFGKVLSVKSGKERGKALYYWRTETRDGVECTGGCLKAWPALLVPKGATVPRKIAGIKGTFGVTKRPDGKRQLTHNGRPLYTYAHEAAGQVLCNNVDNWFVIRV